MSRRLPLAAALVMVALAVAVTTTAPGTTRAFGQTTPAAAQSQLRLADQTTWVADGGTFRVALAVTTPDPATARVQLSVFSALSTRSDFAETLADRIHTSRLKIFDPVALSSLGAAPELSVAVNPKASAHAAQSVRLFASGVYPVRIDLFDSAGNLLNRLTTHLLYSAPDVGGNTKLDVAWVAPFHAPPPTASVPGVASADLSGLVNLGAQLTTRQSVPLTVAATPQAVDTLVNGSPAERSAVAQLAEALGGGTRELVAAPYVRIDLPAMLAAGLDTEVTTQVATGAGILAGALHAVPTSATWIASGPLSAAAVDDLADRGVQRVVTTDNNLTPLPADERARTLAQPFTLLGKSSRIAGVAIDGGLTAHFGTKADQLLSAHQLLADLAVIQLELPNRRGGRGVVVVPPATWKPDGTFLATLLGGLGNAPMLAPVTVDRLFADVTPLQTGTGPLVRRVASPDQPPRGQAITDGGAIRAVRRPVASLAAVVPANTSAIAEINRHVLISESSDLTDRARPAELAMATNLIDHLKAMVRLPGNQSITFTARQGLIPITILSSAPYPLHVRVRVTSQKLGFRPVGLPGGGCTESATSTSCVVDLKAQNTTLRVPVVAKTAGVFSLTVALDSPDGVLNLATNQDTVRSTAASGVGVFLSIGAALLLAVWWVRNVIHGRRARRLIPRATGGGGGGSGWGDGGGGGGRGGGGTGASRWSRTGRRKGDGAGGDGNGGGAGAGGAGAGGSGGPGSGVAPALVRRSGGASVGGVGSLAVGPSARAAGLARRSGARAAVAAPRSRPSVVARPRPARAGDLSGPPTRPVPVVPDDHRSETSRQSPVGRPEPRVPADSFSRNTAVMATGTLLSRLTGFGRVLALIWAFGIASGLTDVYTIANTAPNILYDLVLGGILSATLVPVFVDYLSHDDPEEGWRAISAVITAITVTLVALSVVFWFLAPSVIGFYLVLNNSANAADQRAIGTSLLHMFVPQLFLLGGIAVTTALLNARRRFAAAAFSPVVNNLVAIGAIVIARLIATSLTVPGLRHDQSTLLILGLGTTAGYLLQFAVQLPPMFRSGVRLRPVWDLKHPAVRTVLRLSLWTFGSVMANQISFNLILVLADHRKGDVTVFNTAYQFFQLPYAIFAVSIASVLTTELSEQWARQDLPGFRRQMATGLRLTMAVLVPAALGYVVLARPFLRLVLQHGSFPAADAQRIATVVALFAIGLPGFSAYLLLMRAYQAMQDTRSMFWLYLVENAATLVLAGALYPVMGVRGLALGWVGAYTIGSVAAFAHLRGRTGGLDGQAIASSLLRVLAASAVMILPVFALTHVVKGGSELVLVAQVGGGVLAGIIVYLAAAGAFGVTELTAVLPRRRR